MGPLNRAVRLVLKQCLALQPREYLAVVSDEALGQISDAIWSAAKRVTANLVAVKFANKNITSVLPDGAVSTLLYADAGIVFSTGLLDEHQFDVARQNGTRVVVLPNASIALLTRSLATDFDKTSNLSRKLADLISIGKSVQFKSENGTNATVSISRIVGIAETGLAKNPGELSSIPAGKTCFALNGNIDGRIVVDRIAGKRKKLSKPIIINVNKGNITQIKGEKDAENLRKEIRKYGKAGRKITEFAIGTNGQLSFGYTALEDEKCLGSISFTFGTVPVNSTGKVTLPIKGVVTQTSLNIDGRPIFENGELLA